MDTELAGLSPSLTSSRSGSRAGSTFPFPDGSLSGFSSPQHLQTPEPWVRKLGDDGKTYYYLHKFSGATRWAIPEHEADFEAEVTPTNERPPERLTRKRAGSANALSASPKTDRMVKRNTDVLPARQRSGSVASVIRPLPRITAANRPVELHSDDSEIYPMNRERSASLSSTDGSLSGDSGPHGKLSSSTEEEDASDFEFVPEFENVPELSSTERLAQFLQNALAPPPAELITDLSDQARDAVREVLSTIHIGQTPPLPDEIKMDGLIRSVVLAIRKLVYAAAISPPHIPSQALPRAARERRHTTASQNLLKTPQRKVTATLAKLVLSARAIQYNSGTAVLTTPTRIKSDAEELDRCIVVFVQEVQRCVQMQAPGLAGLKRLHGYFSTANIGLGLVGAGVAATWKGLGWVALDETEEPPGRILGVEVVTELETLSGQLRDNFDAFHAALKSPSGKATPSACSLFRSFSFNIPT